MTNLMHKFLIYLSIYFCLTSFGLSLAHLQSKVYIFGVVLVSWVWRQRLGADTIQRRSLPLKRRKKRKPKTCKAEVN
jgi:arginine exporter protein ArgO